MKYVFQDTCLEIADNRLKEKDNEMVKQLDEYFNGDRERFELELDLPTGFTGQVVEEILKVPYGETRTYGEIAKSLNTAPIAVGKACGRNPLPVIVPCHRVVSKKGLGGYIYGKQVKRTLLRLESALEQI